MATVVPVFLGHYLTPFQAFIVAGGDDGLSSVVTYLPGSEATAWSYLASLPRPLEGARMSIARGRIRLIGGRDADISSRSEVSFALCIY